MKQQRSGMGAAPIVLALLLAGCYATADAARPSHTTDAAIRLPTGSAGGDRPWECCDWTTKDPHFRPSRWRCNDVVNECSDDCRHCQESPAGDGHVCRDWVISLFEPPVCTPRPWDCCDDASCSRGFVSDGIPPFCSCSDEVESCPSNCRVCDPVEEDPPRYRCLDVFPGSPGPKCTPFAMDKH